MSNDLSPALSQTQGLSLSGLEPMLGTLPDQQSPTLLKQFRRFLNWAGKWQQPIFISLLEDPDPKVRERAVRNLRVVGDHRAVPDLLRLLAQEAQPEIRVQIIRALARIGDSQAVPALLEIIKGEAHFQVWLMALSALGELRAVAAFPVMVDAMTHDHPFVRRTALYSLGALDSKQAIPFIVKALVDPDPLVRWLAASRAGEMKSEEAIGGLRACLNDPLPHKLFGMTIADNAAGALRKIGTPEALRALQQMR